MENGATQFSLAVGVKMKLTLNKIIQIPAIQATVCGSDSSSGRELIKDHISCDVIHKSRFLPSGNFECALATRARSIG